MAKMLSSRAGRYVKQPTGYRAFVPNTLPPDPPIKMDDELLTLLSNADRALGRLDGSAEILPNVDLFVYMYVRKEAVLSSQIEGTQASLTDVLEFEARAVEADHPHDVAEVVNHVAAMNYGLERLRELPVSLRLIKEIHAKLLAGVRGSERSPGEFRRSQNWVGPAGCTLANALYVPPPPHEMMEALGDLEHFLHDPKPMPLLIKVGIAHGQFETIHPFLDGNGRVGRLLITFLLCEKKVLVRPLLYLSHYFKRHRAEYYDRLQAIRADGDWEGWLRFFLRGVDEVAREATDTVQRIVILREQHRVMVVKQMGRAASKALVLLERLYYRPIISTQWVKEELGITFPSANTLVGKLSELGFLKEITGRSRNRLYSYEPYLALFEEPESARVPQ